MDVVPDIDRATQSSANRAVVSESSPMLQTGVATLPPMSVATLAHSSKHDPGRPTWWGRLGSRLVSSPDRNSPEVTRYYSKLRLILFPPPMVVGLLLVFWPAVDQPTFDLRAMGTLMVISTLLLTANLCWCFGIWRGLVPRKWYRTGDWASMFAETSAMLLLSWAQGPLTTHYTCILVVMVIVYRSAYDLRIGLSSLLYILGMLWTIIILQTVGMLPIQPGLRLEFVDPLYTASAAGSLSSLVALSFGTLTGFVVTDLLVERERREGATVRHLRAKLGDLEASADQVVGRHTGRRLGDTYRVDGQLGLGGMGEVYRGTHLRTGGAVAIKILHDHLLEDAVAVARFQREAEIAAKVGGENIVRIFDVDRDDGQPFLVMELLEGEDLSQRIASQGRLDPQAFVKTFEQIARALSQIHAAGVTHRDLKPANVFFHRARSGTKASTEEVVKVLDFGVSKLRASGGTALTQGTVGTPVFMSPEQLSGEPTDTPADIYALGALAYCALTGRLPFPPDPAAILQILSRPPVPPSTLRPELGAQTDAVLSIAMAKQPEERWQSADELARALEAALGGTSPPGLLERASSLSTQFVPRGAMRESRL